MKPLLKEEPKFDGELICAHCKKPIEPKYHNHHARELNPDGTENFADCELEGEGMDGEE